MNRRGFESEDFPKTISSLEETAQMTTHAGVEKQNKTKGGAETWGALENLCSSKGCLLLLQR